MNDKNIATVKKFSKALKELLPDYPNTEMQIQNHIHKNGIDSFMSAAANTSELAELMEMFDPAEDGGVDA